MTWFAGWFSTDTISNTGWVFRGYSYWSAGSNSVDGGNNNGWHFSAMPTAVEVDVRMAFGDDMFEATPTWSDISDTVLEVHTQRGRQHELARMEAGTCTLILNNASGDYYPDKVAGAYYPDIKTMVRLNIRASYAASFYDIDVFTGYVESWTPDWLGKSGKGPIVKVVCSDALKVFARALMTNAGEAAELSGARVGNIADEASWPAGWRDIETGKETFQATGAQANVNGLGQLHAVQESELSLAYIAPDNDLQYEQRGHREAAPHNTAELVFGDDPSAGEERYEGVKFVLDEALLYNDVRLTRTGGAEQVYTGAASQTTYGLRSLARSGLLNSTDLATDILAEFLGKRHEEVASRVKTITIRPGKNPGSLWYKVLNYDISTRVNIILDQASIDKDYFIEGIAHDWIAGNDDFTTRWQLSDALQDYPAMAAKTQDVSPDATGDEENINGASAGGDHYLLVIDAGTGTYVENNDNDSSFDRDLYNFETPAYAQGTINKITVTGHFLADPNAKTVQGAVKLAVKSGSTVGESGETVVSIASYEVVTYDWATNPDTSAAWTWAEIASIQAGPSIKKAVPFGGSSTWTRCKYIAITINYTPTWA